MKKIFFSAVLALGVTNGMAQAKSLIENRRYRHIESLLPHIFEDEPLNSWTYPAITQLIGDEQVRSLRQNKADYPLTRYEFAVALTRWRDVHPSGTGSALTPKVQDIAAALEREFADELAKVTELAARIYDDYISPRYLQAMADLVVQRLNENVSFKVSPEIPQAKR